MLTQITCHKSHNFSNNTLSHIAFCYYTHKIYINICQNILYLHRLPYSISQDAFFRNFFISMSFIHTVLRDNTFTCTFFTKLPFNLLRVYASARVYVLEFVHTKVCKTVFLVAKKKTFFTLKQFSTETIV